MASASQTSSEADCPLGELVAANIAHHLVRLDWEYGDLAEHSTLTWPAVVRHRADAFGMTLYELELIANALGVPPADLMINSDNVDEYGLPVTEVASDVERSVQA